MPKEQYMQRSGDMRRNCDFRILQVVSYDQGKNQGQGVTEAVIRDDNGEVSRS